MIRILTSREVGRLLAPKAARLSEAEATVRPILEDVKRRGDAALMEYARRFDGLARRSVRVPAAELAEARARLAPAFRKAVTAAARNIRAYARAQMPRPWRRKFAPGLELGQIVRPLDTVAAYIPAGRYPLPSTLLMTVIPAQVAGVPNICMASPKAVTEVFGAAALAGVERVFEMGGAQAIAAFAYGTRTVPRADRIVGPGNIYVAAAKKLLAGEVGIDFVAGPTEILIVAIDGDPKYLAADMLAQAEHDPDASAVLLTTSRRLAAAVAKEIDRQLAVLPTAPVAAEAIAPQFRHRGGEFARRSHGDRESLRPRAPQHSRRLPAGPGPPRRQRVRRPVQSRKRPEITLPVPITSCPPAAPPASAAA